MLEFIFLLNGFVEFVIIVWGYGYYVFFVKLGMFWCLCVGCICFVCIVLCIENVLE